MRGETPGDFTIHLVLEEVASGKEIASDEVLISLKPIEQFYAMMTADTFLIANDAAYQSASSTPERYGEMRPMPGKKISNFSDGSKVLVFVHGFNVPEDDARNWFSESYKRLFWSGYKDDFVGIHWNGADGDIYFGEPGLHFNTNIEHAFQTGGLLASWLPNSLLQNHTVNIVSHSAGTVATLEALRLIYETAPQTKKILNLITMESATFTNIFSPSLGDFDHISHNGWFNHSLNMVSGIYENFYSANDQTINLTLHANENFGFSKLFGHESSFIIRLLLESTDRTAYGVASRIPGIHSSGDEEGLCIIPHETMGLGEAPVIGHINVNCEHPGFGINDGGRNLISGSHSFMRETNYYETYLLFREIVRVTQ